MSYRLSVLVSTSQQESLQPAAAILLTEPELFWIRKCCSNSLSGIFAQILHLS